jgi:hypothetical protein
MPPEITIFTNGAQRLFLSGTSLNGKLRLNELHLSGLPTGDEVFVFAPGEEFEIEKTSLAEPSTDKFEFKTLPGGLTFSASLLFAGKFFGRSFDLAAGVAMLLVIRIPSSISGEETDQPFFSVEVCGQISLDGGVVGVATERLCFEVQIEKLKVSLPSLHLRLPDIGIDWPRFRIPWRITERIPSFKDREPFRFPPLSISFPESPIKVSWKSVNVSFDAANKQLVIDIEQLRISGLGGAIEADLHLVLQKGEVLLVNSFVNFTRPALGKVSFDNWHFDENCLLVKWKEKQLSEWLRLLAPELADAESADNTEVALRLLRSSGGFSEARLDWRKPATRRVINLPGFKVTFPAANFHTLLFSFRDDNQPSLTLYATVPEAPPQVPGQAEPQTATAESTFSFGRSIAGRQPTRELLNDSENSSPLKLNVRALKEVSVALMDVPLGGGGAFPKFFQQAEAPLVSLLDLFDPGKEKCAPTDNQLIRLRLSGADADWKIALDLGALDTKDFTFPFLKGENQAVVVRRARDEADKIIPPILDPANFIFSCPFEIEVRFGSGSVKSKVTLEFQLERFSMSIQDEGGIPFELRAGKKELQTDFLGMTFIFRPNPQNKLFTLLTKGGDYRLHQATGSEIEAHFGRATSEDNPIIFKLRDFKITSGGVSVKGEVTESPVLLNGIRTEFRFTRGEFEINDNHLESFSLFGSGPLPPDLVGDAIVDLALYFEVRDDRLDLLRGDAKLQGSNLLKCRGTRFEFSLDGVGVGIVNDGGGYHIYFTITGRAKFVPLPIDEDEGPLAWLPAIEMQLLECPLTTDMSVIAQHVNFLVELPEKKTFSFLGCFKLELRGIGFVPQSPFFDGDGAMQLSGQLMFADGADDVIDSSIDCHSLYIGLPETGSLFPRIHFKDITVKVKVGDSFALEGSVEYLDEIEQGLQLKGFAGRGTLEIQGLPTFTVAFSFVRVKREADGVFLRAWFLYIQAGKFSVKTPLWGIYLREIGLGFGYRYTLTSIKEADRLGDDPRQLIARLKELSRTQGELSRRDQWSVDPEEPGQSARWNVVARALFAQTSATNQIFEWNESKEEPLPCLFVMDVVLALRSDFTFLMTGRAWLNTNYHDFLNKESLRERPLVSGFVLLQPRRKRLLAHLASNPGAEFGDHPPLPDYLKQAVSQSRFSATLLLEPGLLHYELGWPNMLQWKAKYGPLNAEFRGGVIFRLSRSEIVYGNSFLARGSLVLSAQAGGSSVGARLSATANVAFGARYIGVLGLQNPGGRSALYGGVGIEVNVRVLVEFWLRLKIGFIKISIDLRLEFSVNFTASLEVGVTAGALVGARGSAAISLSIMGRDLQFKIHIGLNERAVSEAFDITQQYLNIGLEATEVEPIPGTTAASRQLALNSAAPVLSVDAAEGVANATSLLDATPTGAAAADDNADAEDVAAVEFITPHYTIYVIPFGEERSYFVLFPNEKDEGETGEGFLPVPPEEAILKQVEADFEWSGILTTGENYVLKHFDPQAADEARPWKDVVPEAPRKSFAWKANWERKMGTFQKKKKGETELEGQSEPLSLRLLLNQAFIPADKDEPDLKKLVPGKDPVPPWDGRQDSLEDARVHNPSDEAFEAAVRGAAEQFAGSPHFKRDLNSIYEQHLNNAFSPNTSIYSENGQTKPPLKDDDATTLEEMTEHVLQLRSMVVGQIISDLQKYVALEKERRPGVKPDAETADQIIMVRTSVAFQMGLVFKTERGSDAIKPGVIPSWLLDLIDTGTMSQRRKIGDKAPTAPPTPRTVRLFNTKHARFNEQPPQFQRVQHYADASTVAITWDLAWPRETLNLLEEAESGGGLKFTDQQKNPEHYLRHYHVRRISLSGGEREVETEVKMGQCLNLPFIEAKMQIDGKRKTVTCDDGGFDKLFGNKPRVQISESASPQNNGVYKILKVEPKELTLDDPENKLKTGGPETLLIVSKEIQPLRARFQFADHFSEETDEDQAALPVTGRSYAYTITPVDVTGEVSTRPLTIVATRLPKVPPEVPADAEIVVRYSLNEKSFETQTVRPKPIVPLDEKGEKKIVVRWTELPDASGKSRVVVSRYKLIFRKETVFPVGSYGLDGGSQGNSAKGLPTSSARKLRTDIEILRVNNPANIKVTADKKTRRKMFEARVSLQELMEKGIFPRDESQPKSGQEGEWRPESWQVFFQTESTSGVCSALAPIRFALLFAKGDATAERNPSRLEWITSPVSFGVLPPEDEKAAVGFAKVPMPPEEETKPIGVWDDKALKLIYREHPEHKRCLHFEWNQGPSGNDDYPVDMHAGYRLFEFDSDAHLWPEGDPKNPGSDAVKKNLFGQMRRVQEMELLPADEATLRPSTTLVANQWEAWYPSMVRRRQLRESAASGKELLAVKDSKALFNPWYSWRDSYLVWPDDQSMETKDEDADVACVVVGRMGINDVAQKIVRAGGLDVFKENQLVRISNARTRENNGIRTVFKATPTELEFREKTLKKEDGGDPLLLLEGLFGSSTTTEGQATSLTLDKYVVVDKATVSGQTLTNEKGGFGVFRPGQFVQISGASHPPNNGVRQIAQVVSDKSLTFAEGSFSASAAQPTNTVEKVDGHPFATLHPFLARLVADLDNDPAIDVIVDVNPPPTAEPGDLNLLLTQTTTRQDPYGWNILKRMGLSVAFFLRDQRTGEYLEPEGAQALLSKSLTKLGVEDVKRHLFVEHLFQPAKSVRLKDENGPDDPEESKAQRKDLLALIQVSLRPALKQLFHYSLVEIPGNTVNQKEPVLLEISQEAKKIYDLIDLSGDGVAIPVPEEKRTFEFHLPTGKPLALLIRSDRVVKAHEIQDPPTPPDKIIVKRLKAADGSRHESQAGVTPVSPTDWLTTRFGQANWERAFGEKEDFFVQWHRGRRYVLRLNPPNPSNAAAAKFEVPLPDGQDDFNKVLVWLNRFFEHGGDVPPTKGGQLGETAQEVWSASAYPRAFSPVGITPDQTGRLSYHHLIEDKWAHVYRYYFQPYGRYDALWKALSDTLPKEAEAGELLPKSFNLDEQVDVQAGGLDVVLDRIEDVAAPLVLFSGRLDKEREKDAEIIAPGKTWEVIVAKHPEQRLVERNRTLVRRLDYRHIAHTLVRRFAFIAELKQFDKAVSKNHDKYKLINDHLQLVEQKTGVGLPGPYVLEPDMSDEALAREMTRRVGAFGVEALVMQWEALPYFYEHHLLLVAQTSRVVSPVTRITQREFEYQSPAPQAFAEGSESGDGPRKLMVKLTLNTHLDCTPEEAKKRWGLNVKDEAIPEGNFSLSMLPDTGVVYQLVLSFGGDLLETQAEIFFGKKKPEDPDDQIGYYARPLGSKLKSSNADQPIRISPPGLGANKLKDRFILEIFLEPAEAALLFNQQPISSYNDFKQVEHPKEEEKKIKDLEFPVPTSCSLVWDGALSAEEFGILDNFQRDKDWDNSFANAYAQLVKALRLKQDEKKEAFVVAEALVGLEQLREISENVVLPTAAKPEVVWKGSADDRQTAALEQWKALLDNGRALSEYDEALKELIGKIKEKVVEVPFTPDGGKIPTKDELAAALKERLTPGADKFTWKGLNLSEAEKKKLEELADNKEFSQAFRTAVKKEFSELEKKGIDAEEVSAGVKNFKPRPQNEDLPLELRNRLLVANGLIGFRGWMTRKQAKEKLYDTQTARPANQRAIERLFNDSVLRGLGGELKVTARRGTAEMKADNVKGGLLEEK